jgi:DNA-binding response OmpR family regulator
VLETAAQACYNDAVSLPHARASILVVEDDDAMRALLAEELVDAGYAVRTAAGAAAGLELAKAERFDLL